MKKLIIKLSLVVALVMPMASCNSEFAQGLLLGGTVALDAISRQMAMQSGNVAAATAPSPVQAALIASSPVPPPPPPMPVVPQAPATFDFNSINFVPMPTGSFDISATAPVNWNLVPMGGFVDNASSDPAPVDPTGKKVWNECSVCKGKKRMVIDTNPAMYGASDYQVRCNECGGYFMKSTGHSHIDCQGCHGEGGYWVTKY